MYRRVADESPHGQGSLAMLERLLPFWKGKLFVLVLLGFAATDFVITMTLSAADASAHVTENPYVPSFLHGQELWITLGLLALLGAVFLRGFTEAIGVAVVLVGIYLALNVVVLVVSLGEVVAHPAVVPDWSAALTARTREPDDDGRRRRDGLPAAGSRPVRVRDRRRGDAARPWRSRRRGDLPRGRIRGTKRLLTTAAVMMSIFLVASSFATTLLIPAPDFEAGGPANGRALAYLAHDYLGNGFGTVYDASTIAILWFAGASAMAGLLNLIPRYLPRYGMAPEWAGAIRPLVLVLTGSAFLITWVFDASVDAQGGAYATGVLVLITSAAVAVTLAARRAGQRWLTLAFGVITAVFVYTTVDNVRERPDGVKIGACFIVAIVVVSLISRLGRSFELRVTDVHLDASAERFVRDCARRTIRLVANEPDDRDPQEYADKERQIRRDHDLPADADIIFVEVTVTDPSDFENAQEVRGSVLHSRYRVLTLESSSVANALAALLLAVRDLTGVTPHIYFEWTEGAPVLNLAKFLLFGLGEVAPTTREVLRRAEPDRDRRPHVHVG